MRKLYYLLILNFILTLNIISAGFSFDNPNLPKLEFIPEVISFNNNTGFVNASNWWITNIGNLDNANSTQFDSGDSSTLNIKESWLTSFGNALWCALTGCTMEGDIDMNNNNINNIENLTVLDNIFFGDTDHFLRKNATAEFQGIAGDAFQFDHVDSPPEGTIVFIISSNKTRSDIHAINLMLQIGRNNSAGVWGNSMMVLLNNLTNNLTILSNCFLVADLLNETLRVQCDSDDSGPDGIFQDDIQAFGTGFFDEGIRAETLVDFIMNGEDVNIQNGSIHVFTPRTFEAGVIAGNEVIKFDEVFAGNLGAFTNLQTDVGNWFTIGSEFCDDGDCAKSLGISGVGNIIMQANISTININSTTLNFVYSLVNMIGASDFTVTMNNNEGSGEVTILNDATNEVVKSSQSIALPSTMSNKSNIGLRFYCDVTNANRECYVDTIVVNGTAIETTLTNQSGFDSVWKMGDGSLAPDGFPNRGIIYNASGDIIIFRGATAFETVVEIELNVTGSFTLDGETITNFDNISNFDDNVLLRNGSRNLTDNWNTGGFNITDVNLMQSQFLNVTGFTTGDVISGDVDANFGDAYGAIAIGGTELFISEMFIGGQNLNGTFITRNTDGDSNIKFAWVGANDKIRLAIPKEGASFAMYNPRSMMIGGNLGQAYDDGIINCTAQGYRFINCSTDISGADLGIQNSIEFWDSLYGGNGTWNVTDDGDIFTNGSLIVKGNLTVAERAEIEDIVIDTNQILSNSLNSTIIDLFEDRVGDGNGESGFDNGIGVTLFKNADNGIAGNSENPLLAIYGFGSRSGGQKYMALGVDEFSRAVFTGSVSTFFFDGGVDANDDFRLHGTDVWRIHRNTQSSNSVSGHAVMSMNHDGDNTNEPTMVITEVNRRDLDFDIPQTVYPQVWWHDGSASVGNVLKIYHNGTDSVLDSNAGDLRLNSSGEVVVQVNLSVRDETTTGSFKIATNNFTIDETGRVNITGDVFINNSHGNLIVWSDFRGTGGGFRSTDPNFQFIWDDSQDMVFTPTPTEGILNGSTTFINKGVKFLKNGDIRWTGNYSGNINISAGIFAELNQGDKDYYVCTDVTAGFDELIRTTTPCGDIPP